MKLSVVICTYNREEYILQSLNSLVGQSISQNKFELIVINNNSTDNTDSICRKFISDNPDLNIVYYIETNQGLSYSRNRGIDLAIGDVIIFIDDDAFLFSNYLEEVYKIFEKDKNIGAFGGKIIPKFESSKPKWMSSFLMSLASVIDLGDKIIQFPRNKYPIGANMGVNRNIFLKYGNFNVDLGRKGKGLQGGEEKDLFLKLRKGNEKIIYLPNAIVHHIVPDKRMQSNFIKKQAFGIGFSEKVRSISINNSEVILSFINEFIKWGASICLFLYFLVIFQPSKGIMIIKFRYWVTKGFLLKKL